MVYRAFDHEIGAEVALKTLEKRDPESSYLLKREFRSLAGVCHRNLVELYELVVTDEESFFTMELIEGLSFVDFVRAVGSGEARLDRMLAVGRQLGEGLAALHAAGKLHRDIKPPNVLVDGNGRVVLLDFGFTIAPSASDIQDPDASEVVGTLSYMAPEVLWGAPPEEAADWYSTGVIFYEALTGRLPHSGRAALVRRSAREMPQPPSTVDPSLPARLDGAVMRLLHPDPAQRRSPVDLLARVDLNDRSPLASSPPPRPEAAFVGRRTETATLRAAYESVGRGAPAVVQVYGPSGIGKTELVQHFVCCLESEGALVLRGRCHPYEQIPYKGLDTLIDCLSRYLLSLPADAAGALLPPHAAELLRVFPVLARVPGFAQGRLPEDTEPFQVRRRAFSALRQLLGAIADQRRLVLWIDDLQWADADSAVALRDLLHGPVVPPILLLLSFRSEDRAQTPFLAELWSLPLDWARELAVAGLDGDDIRVLLRQVAPDIPAEFIEQIASEAGGSPFFAAQLARYAGHGPAASGGVQAFRLESVVGNRLEELAPPEREILEIVSVAGHPIERRMALGAAGMAERHRPLLVRLERETLLRATSLDRDVAVEIYHDKIREAIITRLTPEVLRRRHGQIAEALVRAGSADSQDLFTHYLGAGDQERARPYGVTAAERAAEALAFDRAAALYRQVLELELAGDERRLLVAKLADALANSGRGSDAAEQFEAAASLWEEEEGGREVALSLHRRAAEQYLRAGSLERGIQVTRDVLAHVGVRLPVGAGRSIATALWQRTRLLVARYDRVKPLPAISSQQRLRLDTCWGSALALSVMDQMASELLTGRHLLEASRVGERSHVARALGLEAVKSAQLGGRFLQRRSVRLLRLAEEMSRDLDDPYSRAFHLSCVGAAAYERAEWRKAFESCDAATSLYRAECTGAVWESVTTQAFALSALAHMGDLLELGRRLPAAIADADDRGDLYGAIGFRSGIINLLWLAQGRADYARQQTDGIIARWPADGFHLQHYLHLLASAHIDLYVGEPWAAWQRIREAWPKLKRAHYLSLDGPKTELLNLRGRVALAAACHRSQVEPSWPRPRLLRLAEGEAQSLSRLRLRSARPLAALLRAGVSQARGETDEAARRYAEAAEDFRHADMKLYEIAARHPLISPASSAAASVAAEAEALGVRDLPALTTILAPQRQ